MEQMNTQEVLKRLEKCIHQSDSCENCTHKEGNPKEMCVDRLLQEAHDTIKELKSQLTKRQVELDQTLSRIRHLLQSSFIASFDEVDPNTQFYVKDIQDADKMAADLHKLRNRITCSVSISNEQVQEIKAACIERIQLDVDTIRTQMAEEILKELNIARLTWKTMYDRDYYGYNGSATGYLDTSVDDTIHQLRSKFIGGKD